MARSWRLRHKLVFGVALVLGSIGLLIGGAALGLASYVEAGRLTDHKLHQMKVIFILRDNIYLMASGNPKNRQEETTHLLTHHREADNALTYYRQTLKTTDPYRYRDPDDGEGERHAVKRIDEALAALKRAVTSPGISVSATGDQRVIDDVPVRKAYGDVLKESMYLFTIISTDIENSFKLAESDRRRGTIIAVGATAVALVLILTLLYYFKVWVFSPIRQLQAGVLRVHSGDFNTPIRLASQDELEELANEFNAMTARLRDVYADLARQVNERSRQLVRSERMVSVGFLAAGVAHEINNPLASIAFCSEALERRVQDVVNRLLPGDAEVLTKYLKVIQTEAFRCKQITQKLLDFSRSGEGRREHTDLGRLVQDVIDVAKPLPNARGKTIQFQPVYVVASINPPDMKSVVLNLVVNALDSMEEGGVLAISLGQVEQQAEIRFRDNGCGMSADVLNNLFEPFFTKKRTGNGTGLGLSISHQIIDQHGGTIHVTSDGNGTGSTFIVRFPVQATVVNPPPQNGDILPMQRANIESRAA